MYRCWNNNLNNCYLTSRSHYIEQLCCILSFHGVTYQGNKPSLLEKQHALVGKQSKRRSFFKAFMSTTFLTLILWSTNITEKITIEISTQVVTHSPAFLAASPSNWSGHAGLFVHNNFGLSSLCSLPRRPTRLASRPRPRPARARTETSPPWTPASCCPSFPPLLESHSQSWQRKWSTKKWWIWSTEPTWRFEIAFRFRFMVY